MERSPATVFVAILGGQPQIVTLALDALRHSGTLPDAVIAVHLAPDERIATGLDRLKEEFAHQHYAGRPCHWETQEIRLHGAPLLALTTNDALDAAREAFRGCFAVLRRQSSVMHLCISGGPRLLGHVALAAATLTFRDTDRVWHLHSSQAVRERTRDGNVLHVAPSAEVALLRVPLPPAAEIVRQLHEQSEWQAPVERERCLHVWRELKARERAVLCAFAEGLQPGEVAERLGITSKTVDSHKTTIFHLCRNAWPISPSAKIDYRWLCAHFAVFCKTV